VTVACDFCKRLAERHDGTLFLESASGLAHICEGCVATCTNFLSRTKLKQRRQPARRANPHAPKGLTP
jgi:hypothetical protein